MNRITGTMILELKQMIELQGLLEERKKKKPRNGTGEEYVDNLNKLEVYLEHEILKNINDIAYNERL